MTTPSGLRMISLKSLERARRALDDSDWDDAAHRAGFAVELALKARVCTSRQLADFPQDKATLKARGLDKGLHSHDLEKLLRLSPNSFHLAHFGSVRWDVVAAWDNEDRYKDLGNVNEAAARSMVDECTQLIRELTKFDAAEALWLVHQAFTAEVGPVPLFVWTWLPGKAEEQILWASPSMRPDAPEALGRLLEGLVPSDLRPLISGQQRTELNSVPAMVYSLFGPPPGFRICHVRHCNFDNNYIGNVFVRSFPISNAYVIGS